MLNKVPPHHRDAEKAVLGACLLEREAFDTAQELLSADSFYDLKHQEIFRAMECLKGKGCAIDLLTVSDELQRVDKLEIIGGAYALVELTNQVVSSAHLRSHCHIVAEKYFLREIIRIGGEFVTSGYSEDTDTFEVIEKAEKRIYELSGKFTRCDVARVDNVLIHTLKRLEELRNRDRWLTGVPSGYPDLDRLTCGWQSTDLIVLAARPACGKTAFSLNLARNAASAGEGVGIFNLEMSSSQVVQRILANESHTPLKRIRDARLTDEDMNLIFQKGVKKLATKEIYLDDTPSLNVFEFKSKARRMVQKYGVKLIILDYLQLMKSVGQKQSREQEIATISRELKITAKELQVPIIALSQLSRAVEHRGSGVPQLSDLRESGAIEQDADMVLFLYGRPEAETMLDPARANDIFLKVAKHRNGELETFEFDFERPYQRFCEKGVAQLSAMGQYESAPF